LNSLFPTFWFDKTILFHVACGIKRGMRYSLLFITALNACPADRTVLVLRHGFLVINAFHLIKVMELCKAKTHAVKPFLSFPSGARSEQKAPAFETYHSLTTCIPRFPQAQNAVHEAWGSFVCTAY